MILYNFRQKQAFFVSPFDRSPSVDDVASNPEVLFADFQCPFCNGLSRFQVVLSTYVSFVSFRFQLEICFAKCVERKNKMLTVQYNT